ncbi:diguanylate phosphodiesterase [[Leptolyngbya] sp. PCC 7376]|uniref:EAL domain-containing protein n=1 Tax=[Leptolyngbya] sp. PCC 7376 TaxID=111781 RepID=UPI00029EE990|nr:EAL domain-containing protein [[Leptolyngbya] sp. PCC 7376]AFY37557.1 diguanylate phosphodiesterase [[Leptolyngbya] sp. PCC 7376]
MRNYFVRLNPLSLLKESFEIKPFLLLREAFLSLLPIVLVMNILVLFSGLTSLLEFWGVTDASAINGDDISRLYFFLIPLFVNLSLSSLLAKEKGLDQIGTILIAMVCFFRVSGFLIVNDSAQLISYHGSILTSIPSTWIAVRLLHYFLKFSKIPLTVYQNDINPRLKQTLNLIIPGLLTVAYFEFIGQIINIFLCIDFSGVVAYIDPRFYQLSEILELILYKTISLFTWFIGLHGEHSADGLFRLINDIPNGENYSIRLKTFHDVFMNIGGSGSTFVIPFLILFSKRIKQFKSIARLSLPFSFFNVNEILLFGLPILLNPIFLIPFVVVPFVNMAIALSAVHFGLFHLSLTPVHWMSPPLYSAYAATDGSGLSVLTQFLCLVVDSCIYFPFLLLSSRQYQAPSYLLNLFGEDAHDFIQGEVNHQQERIFIAKQRAKMKNMTSAQQVLKKLRGGQFLLYFQPKFNAQSLELVGLEALLRFQNYKGEILPPTFLPVLYQQGLSKIIDKKVVDLAFLQILRWQSEGLLVPPIALNFDKEFLLDQLAVKEFIDRAKYHNICFYIEITEHTYTVEISALASVVQQLRTAGHRISIDDFGAGYSSLTTLLALKADEIKLDRKLIFAPTKEAQRGQILLSSSIQLCHDLGFSVVAEGVETVRQMNLVQRCGADIIQGYYLGRPMSSTNVSQLFDSVSFHD